MLLDKYYTKPEVAALCLATLPKYGKFDYLEPSAGNGSFSNQINCLAYDIAPEAEGIIQQDFFQLKPKKNNIAVIGNPPFGKNASLAIKFFNHAATFASLIAFIVPKSFKKVSIQNKLSLNWVLQEELELPKFSFLADGNSYDVPCVWQVWVPGSRKKITLPTTHPDIQFTTKESANFCIRRVGALAGKCFREFDQYAESSNYFLNVSEATKSKLQSLFEDFQDVAKNTVGNPSLSKTELIYIYSHHR